VICEPWAAKQAPATPHAARWSLPIVVAARLAEGRVDLGTFERPLARAVLELAQRISWEPLADARFPERFEAELVCGPHVVRIDDVYGNPSRPATAQAVREKFIANGASVELWDAVHSGR
jgi:2-methylcitrate dehydratase PrpD